MDHIPHPDDRAQVRRMIARSSEVESEPDFDASFDHEFEAELRELERDAARFPRIIARVFLTLSILLLATGVISSARIQSPASTALKWVMPAIATFLGVAFLAAAAFARRMFKSNQEEPGKH